MCTEDTQTQTQEKTTREAAFMTGAIKAAHAAAGYHLDPRTESMASVLGIASDEPQEPMTEQDESASARINRLETAREEETIREALKKHLMATSDLANRPWPPAVVGSTARTAAKIEGELAIQRSNLRRLRKLERLAVLVQKYPYVVEIMDLMKDLGL